MHSVHEGLPQCVHCHVVEPATPNAEAVGRVVSCIDQDSREGEELLVGKSAREQELILAHCDQAEVVLGHCPNCRAVEVML